MRDDRARFVADRPAPLPQSSAEVDLLVRDEAPPDAAEPRVEATEPERDVTPHRHVHRERPFPRFERSRLVTEIETTEQPFQLRHQPPGRFPGPRELDPARDRRRGPP